jgi:hypothetical protein
MSSWFRFWFLFSSFGPLYAIFTVKLWLTAGLGEKPPAVAAAAFVVSVMAFLFLRSRLHSDNGTVFEITDVKSKDSEVFSYITTYIPPVILRDMSDASVYIPLAIFYAIIFMCYMTLDSPYLNPFFILFRYRIYEGRIKGSRALVTIIAKDRRLAGTEEVRLYEIGTGDLYYCFAE